MGSKMTEFSNGLEYDKDYKASNFIIRKIREDYTEELKAKLAETGIANGIKEAAEQEGYIPYIVIRDKSGLWETKLIFGIDMYFIFDGLETDGDSLTEECTLFVETIVRHMFCSCINLMDVQFYRECDRLFQEALERKQEAYNRLQE